MRPFFPGLLRLAFLCSLAVLSQAGRRPANAAQSSAAIQIPGSLASAHSQTCTTCSFNMLTPWVSSSNQISSSGGTISFTMVCHEPGTLIQGINYQIATISGGCVPSANRFTNINYNGNVWQVEIGTDAVFYAKMTSGPSLPPNTVIDLQGSVSQ
jgi:hypothetical protein